MLQVSESYHIPLLADLHDVFHTSIIAFIGINREVIGIEQGNDAFSQEIPESFYFRLALGLVRSLAERIRRKTP